MAYSIDNVTGIEIRPDGPFHADILYDYLNTTTYRWKCNETRTKFFIEAFEYTPEELCDSLTCELREDSIMADIIVIE